MDYHSEFRMGPRKQGKRILGQAPQTRFPLSQPPRAREHCRVEQSEQEGDTLDRVPVRTRQRQDSAKVRAQVKQLKFWLKVFSRFCHEEAEPD
jgi:hypothetical protein